MFLCYEVYYYINDYELVNPLMIGVIKMIKFLSAVSVLIMLNACSSAVFPEIVEEDDTTLEMEDESSMAISDGKVGLKLPEEGSSLTSDKANAAYDEEDELLKNEMALKNEEPEKVAAAKTKPILKKSVLKELNDSGDEEETVLSGSVTEVAPSADDVQVQTLAADYVPSVSYRMDTFYFANGSAELAPADRAKIRNIVKEAKAKNAEVTVMGFASSRTRNTDIVSHKLANFNISLQRAQNVAKALQRAGLGSQNIKIEALSDTAPVYLEVMPEGEKMNRRAEVYISY